MQLRALFSGSTNTPIRVERKTVAALAVTAGVHGILASLVLNASPPLPWQEVDAIDVALVFDQTAIEDERPTAPDMEDIPRPEPLEVVSEAEDADGLTVENPPAAASSPPASARSADEAPVGNIDPAANAYALSPGTQSVLRGLQCPGDPDAFARTGICPQGAGRHTQMVAADETASSFYLIDVDSIRAQFGQGPHPLSGQATLDNGTQRHSLSNADSMRDALPASRPDPAFGD